MALAMQRKKPGYTKNGEVKIISLNGKQLLEMLPKTQKKRTIAKITRRLGILGIPVPTPTNIE